MSRRQHLPNKSNSLNVAGAGGIEPPNGGIKIRQEPEQYQRVF